MTHDPFEDRIRDSLRARSDVDVDADDFLGSVHAAARHRRRRSVVVTSVAAVAVIVGGVFGLDAIGWQGHPGPAASKRPVGTSNATTGPRTTQPPIDVGFTPLSLTATGADDQWVLGTTGCDAPRCLFIKHIHRDRLVDDVTAPPAKVGVTGARADAVSQIRFVGAGGTHGWAFGGALWSTHDAGRSWQRVRLPVAGRVTALEAWGDHVYAAVQQAGRAQLVTSPVPTDRWQPVALPATFRRIDSIATGAHVTAVAGEDGTGRAVVLTNTDRTRWARTDGCVDRTSAQVSTAPGALWLLCRTGNRATAYVSADGGRTFRAAHGTFGATDQIAARTPTSAIVAGDDGVIEASTTAYPRQILDVPGFAHGPASVRFAGFTNASDGYLITLTGELVRTTDGGGTWGAVRLRP